MTETNNCDLDFTHTHRHKYIYIVLTRQKVLSFTSDKESVMYRKIPTNSRKDSGNTCGNL